MKYHHNEKKIVGRKDKRFVLDGKMFIQLITQPPPNFNPFYAFLFLYTSFFLMIFFIYIYVFKVAMLLEKVSIETSVYP